MRDGRSFTTRRVVARQKDATIFVMTASFHEKEPGFEHAAPPPPAPPPDACLDPREAAEGLEGPARLRALGALDWIWPIEVRQTGQVVDASAPGAPDQSDTRQSVWIRIGRRLPDDPALHRAAIVYLSDMTLLGAALRAHGISIHDRRIQVASLDHAFWLHRRARADAWLLYAQDTPNASGATALVRGILYAGDGTLVASVAQEGLLRRRNDP